MSRPALSAAFAGEETVVASGTASGAGVLSNLISTSTEYQFCRVRITTAVGYHRTINEVELKSEELDVARIESGTRSSLPTIRESTVSFP